MSDEKLVSDTLKEEIEERVGSKIRRFKLVGGGSLTENLQIELSNGHRGFLKLNPSYKDAFEKEAYGLEALRSTGCFRIPRVYAQSPNFLLIEWIDSQKPTTACWKRFGRAFAQLHQNKSEYFGFEHNNYLGRAPQKNLPQVEAFDQGENWTDFFLEYRIDVQVSWAKKNDYDLSHEVEIFKARAPKALAPSHEIPSLLHGDLWSGNFLCDLDSQPVLIDPACSYGHREMDLAMITLFGGFPKSFFEAYHYEYPLKRGWESRQPIYKVYHVLNHLNLFGGRYLPQARSMMIG